MCKSEGFLLLAFTKIQVQNFTISSLTNMGHDLNPIKHCLGELDRLLWDRPYRPAPVQSSLSSRDKWEQIPGTRFQNLDSLPKRVEADIAAY